jgi:general secretion pathway protein H
LVKTGQQRHGYLQGFTLLELMVVFVIMGLMLAVAPPLLSNAMPTLTLKGAAQDLVLNLNQVRSQAITRSLPQGIRFYPEAGYYLIEQKQQRESLPKETRLLVEGGIPLEDGSDGQLVRFFPDGSSSGGRITLRNESRGYRVEINWLTGRSRSSEVDSEAG